MGGVRGAEGARDDGSTGVRGAEGARDNGCTGVRGADGARDWSSGVRILDDDDDDTGRDSAGAGADAADASLGGGTAEAATDAVREGVLLPRDETGCADAATGTGGGQVDPARDTDEALLREEEDAEADEEGATKAGTGGAAALFLCEDRDAPDATDCARLESGSSWNSCSSPCSSSSCGPTSATGGDAPGRDWCWYLASENGRDTCGDECSSSKPESEEAESSECRCCCRC